MPPTSFRSSTMDSQGGYHLFDSIWYPGVGAKEKMKARAALTGAKCELQIQDPETGFRGFTCYETWSRAIESLESLGGGMRHVFEIITYGKPCKPYIDFDGSGINLSVEEITTTLEDAITRIFKEDYDLALQPHDFIWTLSPNPDKISLHMTVSKQYGPMFVFRSNHQDDSHGAFHLAARVKALLPALSEFVDGSVYTKDREMRLLGSCKYGRADVLEFLHKDRGYSAKHAAITWIDGEMQIIEVPYHIHRNLAQRKRTCAGPRGGDRYKDEDSNGAWTSDLYIERRMLELLQEKVHQTAFRDKGHGHEDPWDPLVGVKFNHVDRKETCFTGVIHEGTQNVACFVDEEENVIVRCFSEKCKGRVLELGPLHDDPTIHLVGAVHVSMPYLKREQLRSEEDASDNTARFNSHIDCWLAGDFKVLNIKSGMGTGKTTMLKDIIEEGFKNKRVLVVTYRISLTSNQVRKLPGFVSYLDVEPWEFDGFGRKLPGFECRQTYPKVICQLDSIHRLFDRDRVIPEFDLIILDEVCSLLQHMAAPTLSEPVTTCNMFCNILEEASRVLCLDAAWGLDSFQFFQELKQSQGTIINGYVGTQRTFVFGDREDLWTDAIIGDLKEGKNIVLATMSSELGHRVKTHVLSLDILQQNNVVLHTRTADDALKKELLNVDQLWKTRLVIYSPTVESGVDFDVRDHFHRMYVYACTQSTTVLGLLQMTGRIRHLKDPRIQCCVGKGIRLGFQHSHPRATYNQKLHALRYIGKSAYKSLLFDTKVRIEGGKKAVLLPDSPMLVAIAHAEARISNTASRFMSEFKRLVEDLGHRVQIAPKSEEDAKYVCEAPEKKKVQMLVEAKDLNESEFERIFQLICQNKASEPQKWAYDKHLYKQAWGIDRVDHEFVKENGTALGHPGLSMFKRVFGTNRAASKELGPLEAKLILKADIAREIFWALGFEHPFDFDKIVPIDDIREKLLSLEMFKNHNRYIKMFGSKACQKGSEEADWSYKNIKNVLDSVLSSFGVHLQHDTLRIRNAGGRTRKYNIALNRELNSRFAEFMLLRFRTHGVNHALPPAILSFVLGMTLERYEHLVDTSDTPITVL